MNTSKKAAIVIVVVALLYLVVSNVFRDHTPEEEARTAISTSQDLSKLVRVEEMHAQQRTLNLTLYGDTEANRLVKLKAETESQVIDIPAKEGGPVKEGEVILKLEPRDRLAKVEQAKALVKQRKLEYEASQKLNKSGYDSDVGFARKLAGYEEAKAMLAAAQEDYSNTFIRAPFDGVLERVTAEVGDLVGRGFVINGDDSVATVVDNDPIVVVGQVPQQRRSRLEKDQPASVRIEGGKIIEGTVRYLGTVTDPATRTFRVEVEIPNPENHIPVGISAELHLPAGTTDAYLVAPSALSLDDEGNVGVKTVDASGKVAFQKVDILEDGTDGVWIGGMHDTVRLVTLGHNYVSPGQQLDMSTITVHRTPNKQSEVPHEDAQQLVQHRDDTAPETATE